MYEKSGFLSDGKRFVGLWFWKSRSYVYVAQLTISVSSVVLVIKHAVMFTQYSLQYLFLHYLELMLE